MHILIMVYHGILWESMEKCKIFNIFLLFFDKAEALAILRVAVVDKFVDKTKKAPEKTDACKLTI